MRRVNESVRSVVSDALQTEFQDPRIGFVTVTSVDTSPDLRHARVWVTVLGDEAQRAETLDALRAGHGRLQRMIGSQLKMKHTPELDFRYDDSVDRGLRVDEILEEVIDEEESA
jgi:ribosome-binding factor A